MKTKTYPISLLITGVILITSVSCKKEQKIAPINFNSSITYGNMTDQDGNSYKTVIIDNKTWMAENLKTTKYRNGDLIPNISGKETWNVSSGACCIYNDDNAYSNIYGLFYNWYAINDSRNIAPAGWHVATDAEWRSLVSLIGGSGNYSSKLKERGTMHWSDYQYLGTDDFGFAALPGGCRDNVYFGPPSSGTYLGIGTVGIWWTPADTTLDGSAWALGYNMSYVTSRSLFLKIEGLSVRCVKDSV